MSTDQNPEEPKPVTGAEQGELAALTPEPTQTQSMTDADKANESVVTELFKIAEADKKETSEPAKAETKPEVIPAPAVETPVLELPVVRHPYDEADDPDPDQFVDPKFSKIHENVDKLRTKLRKAREEGSFGKTLVDMAKQHGIDPAQLAELVTRNIRLTKGDPTAVAEVAAELQRRGVKFAEEKKVDPVEEETKRIYDATFAEDVKAGIADEDYAKRKARSIAEKTAKPVTPPSPVNNTPPPPVQDYTAQIKAQASAEVNDLATQFQQAYTKAGMDFGPVATEAHRRIKENADSKGELPPQLWNYEYSRIVQAVQREFAAKAAPTERPAIKTGTPLRPTTTPSAPSNASLDSVKSSLVDELMSNSN